MHRISDSAPAARANSPLIVLMHPAAEANGKQLSVIVTVETAARRSLVLQPRKLEELPCKLVRQIIGAAPPTAE